MHKKSLKLLALISPFAFASLFLISSRCVNLEEKKFNQVNQELKIEYIKGTDTIEQSKSNFNIEDFYFETKNNFEFEVKPLYITFSKEPTDNWFFVNYQIFNKLTGRYSKIFTKKFKSKQHTNDFSKFEKNLKEILVQIFDVFEKNKVKLDELIAKYEHKYLEEIEENKRRKYKNIYSSYAYLKECIKKTKQADTEEFNLILTLKALQNKKSLDFVNNQYLIRDFLIKILEKKDLCLEIEHPDFIDDFYEKNKYSEFVNSGMYELYNQMKYWISLNSNENWTIAEKEVENILKASQNKCIVVSAVKKWCSDCIKFKEEIYPKYNQMFPNDEFKWYDFEDQKNEQVNHLIFSLFNNLGAKRYGLRVPYTIFVYKGNVISEGTEIDSLENLIKLRKIYENK
ncbi:hypothetical protein ACJA25_01655 [Mycoplasmopsis hyopharyngis]|uniref:hypothetical protein n=1 Tax=Mycoplasmopsis hyopharyngis TaxID=29558 RepID=UPI003873BAE9